MVANPLHWDGRYGIALGWQVQEKFCAFSPFSTGVERHPGQPNHCMSHVELPTVTGMASFAEFYERPDLEHMRAESSRLASACDRAASAEEFLGHVGAWNRLRATFDTHNNIAMVRYSQNTQDPAIKAEQDFWDSAAPTIRELDVLYASTLLKCSHSEALDAEYGPQLRKLLRCTATTFVDEIRDALTQEATATSEYTNVVARSEVSFRGQSIGLSELDRYFDDPDRQVRQEAHQAQDRFLAANSEALDSLYDQLVATRDRMGKALGHADYIPLAYQLHSRTDYGPDQVATFRDAIVREIVPIASELHAAQARDLGLDSLLYHDEPAWDPAGNARPIGDSAAILEAAQQMYREFHGELDEFFAMMRKHELIDVDLRKGKAGGGFCTQFADLGLPFIFANFNGSDRDIIVITHECGHAFQVYSSQHVQPRVEYAYPTYEACEVHSMSLEFLTYPWMHLFFGDRADSYRRTHLRKVICLLPYTALVDHFQHEVYSNPSWTPAERNQRWAELERRYLPHRNYGGLYPQQEKGTRWQRQRHIYRMPFYYIDYALAEICAMQMWRKSQSDRQKTMDDYLAICRVGGSESFLDMLALGDLRSPFDPECIADVARHLRTAIAG